MDHLPTSPALARALSERNYTSLTPVQTAIMEPGAAGRDLLVSARTGSGKTVAFGLAIADTLLDGAETFTQAGVPLALVVAPTRELALQVQRELEWLYEFTGARVVACVGGMDPRREARSLGDGAHIVVGTPGRLRDHLERGALKLGSLRAVVLDEADEMLDLGFRDDIEFILDATPEDRRTLLFSATLPRAIVTLAQNYQRDAERIEVGTEEHGHTDIEYRCVRIVPRETEYVVVNLLRFVDAPCSIVFANTRDACRHLQATLQERGFSAVLLSGELGQGERNLALQALRDGRARVCVATDVAARGIDLPNLGLVVHAELPRDAETLQHRSGRTGRAGRKGLSVLLVPQARRRKAERLIYEAGLDPSWSGPPSAEDIRALDRTRILQDPLLTAERSEDDLELARALLEGRSPEDIAAAFASLYRQRLPAAEEVTDPAAGRSERPRRERPEREDRPGRPDRDERRPTRDERFQRAERGEHALGEGSTWFRLDLGRRDNADPKWLLPMLCRRGNIDRNDIGSIRIFDNETKFEVRGSAAAKFIENSALPDEEGVNIELVSSDNRMVRRKAERPGPAGGRASGDRPRTFRDRAPRDGGDERPSRAPRPEREDRGEDRPRPRRERPESRSEGYEPLARRDEAPARDERPARAPRPPREDRPARAERPARSERPQREDRPRPERARPDYGRSDEGRPSRAPRGRADGDTPVSRPRRPAPAAAGSGPRGDGFGPKGPRGLRKGSGPGAGPARGERGDRGDRPGKPGGRPAGKSGPGRGPRKG